jgi:hypothetical protein
MKKILLFGLLLTAINAFSQTTDTIVQWTFPDSSLAQGAKSDGGIPVNIGNPITTIGGTGALVFNHAGLTSYCARATGWDGGSGLKYWLVYFTTLNYNTLKLSSKQQSATSSEGPRDFKVQYATSFSGIWTDVPTATVLDSNDWTHGVLSNVDLPAACNDKDTVYLRWIMTSNTSVSGATVLQAGPNKIDDIYITGVAIPVSVPKIEDPHSVNLYQNYSNNTLTVFNKETIKNICLYDIIGKQIYSKENPSANTVISTSGFNKGIYIIKVLFDDNAVVTRKITL